MSDYDMSIHTNPDASAWARFFMKTAKENQWDIGSSIDEDLMNGWFSNAMMAMHDHLRGVSINVLPDGSAFFSAEIGQDDKL